MSDKLIARLEAPVAFGGTNSEDGWESYDPLRMEAAGALRATQARIAELEDAIRDEMIRGELHSTPRKLEFMKSRGMNDLDEVHEWMRGVRRRLEELVGEKR